ncbi:plasminogen activator inhibitor 2, macrophage [Helicoverpa armigera]|uniref:plasminogen activator inhibitor 2, macrophage n=1 Tax=Helicoverpa armigera TaxID=29058 RepID=UPI00308338BA
MRVFIFAILVACAEFCVSTPRPHNFDLKGTHLLEPCNVHIDVSHEYRSDLYEFAISMYRAVAARKEINFVYSPLSVWIMLAGLAEGSDPYTQQQLFSLLKLPYDACTRQKYYQYAGSRLVPSEDVKIISNRVLLLDAGVTPNPTWYDLVLKNNIMDVLTAPLHYNPVATTNELRRLLNAHLPSINLKGNSILVDTVDYNGLWTTEFADARIERAPFYDQLGNAIGFVDLMKVTKRAKLGYVKSLKAKVVELPVGGNEQYKMIFALFPETDNVRNTFNLVTSEIVFEMFDSFKESNVPVEIAIPRFVTTNELDIRTVVEDLGVTSLWTDPAATRNVSHPPALPSSWVHRATLTLDNHGVYSSPFEVPQATPYVAEGPTGLDPKVGNEFTADRPFLFALFDVETLTCLVASSFSVPTYK